MSALRTEIEDPHGFVRLTLGDDGRLLTLFIDDAMRASLTNLALEKKLNALFEAGNEAMRLSRRESWDSMREFGRGPSKKGAAWRAAWRASPHFRHHPTTTGGNGGTRLHGNHRCQRRTRRTDADARHVAPTAFLGL